MVIKDCRTPEYWGRFSDIKEYEVFEIPDQKGFFIKVPIRDLSVSQHFVVYAGIPLSRYLNDDGNRIYHIEPEADAMAHRVNAELHIKENEK